MCLIIFLLCWYLKQHVHTKSDEAFSSQLPHRAAVAVKTQIEVSVCVFRANTTRGVPVLNYLSAYYWYCETQHSVS